ncbi:phosphoheptose isomerase [Nonomuraea deserti]|uniref:Phosphoheptose isomerase n=1 Tax=Nonomuraea deserti TaxID=1848322 RepID=A0A4V2Y5Q2_9ACTN|nr:phosphoheptose isomerase [Nonomuraea deserti]TDC85115.1 phosphoheptose isomerase [Nonomuraea deserti]
MAGVLDQVRAGRESAGLALVADAGAVVEAAAAMAGRFRRGSRLLSFGRGAAAADAAHVAVEFSHPVIVGKPALPALCLGGEPGLLPVLGRPGDIAVGVLPAAGDLAAARELGMLTVALVAGATGDARATAGESAAGVTMTGATAAGATAEESVGVTAGATAAGATLEGVVAGATAAGVVADHVLAAHSEDPLIVREIHITVYHLLWELAHVFLESEEAR